MTVKKKTYTAEYWECGRAGHRHIIEATAQACHNRRVHGELYRKKQAAKKKAWDKQTLEFNTFGGRHKVALAMWNDGKNMTQIAQYVGLTRERIKQIIAKARSS